MNGNCGIYREAAEAEAEERMKNMNRCDLQLSVVVLNVVRVYFCFVASQHVSVSDEIIVIGLQYQDIVVS